ncbi:MAG: hypothetical protein GX139_03975 [Armatimonadetes bacterium]|nr:hypothetical protein [Armatimonadota bacterium]
MDVRGWEWGGDTGSNLGHLTSEIEKSRSLTTFEMTYFVWLGQRPVTTITHEEVCCYCRPYSRVSFTAMRG